MSWYSKVAWKEGLFLQPHHLQQHDRYVEKLVESRTRLISPYPWGFAQVEPDRDVAQQNKYGLRAASGIFQDGTPFDMPGTSALPPPIEIPEGCEGMFVWLTMPMASANGREVGTDEEASRGSRYFLDRERVADSAAAASRTSIPSRGFSNRYSSDEERSFSTRIGPARTKECFS